MGGIIISTLFYSRYKGEKRGKGENYLKKKYIRVPLFGALL